MGVPSFYRWLVTKYPKVVTNAIEERGQSLDTSLPNPNGIEFDNLYLDMNGIIHPCFHPEEEDEGISIPSTLEEVFTNIFQCIDRLFSIVRPRKLLYMAIDGVAPRAKMNQQRSRRFRTAKDKEEAENEEMRLRREFEREGKLVLPKEESEVSDSNIITPGTEFMDKLSKALKGYIKSRLSSDLGWRDIEVILSDANVPGEGEHKIISFIRQQRTLPSYNPNTRHCLYGLDADLIMLALATHEIHFSILREDIIVQEQSHLVLNCNPSINASLSEPESSLIKSEGLFESVSESETKHASFLKRKPYQFLHVWILREYLEMDMQISDPPENFKFDIERIVDDFIFMCFFVGNDFLPHTPSLAIHEGSIDLLMTVYKKELKKIGGYLLDMIRVDDKKGGYLKSSRVEKFILSVGSFEEKIFKKRSLLRDRKLRRLCLDAVKEDDNGSCNIMNGAEFPNEEAQSKDSSIASCENISSNEDMTSKYSEILKNTKELKEKVKNNIRKQSDLFKNGSLGIDKVRLGSPGYKERYYKEKFCAETPGERESTRKRVVEKYTEGLHWVLLYYFAGPPSWTWFYPFHYGPFVSDLKGLSQVKVKFQEGSPLKPFDQLLAVLPPRSVSALPNAYHGLMKEDSPLIDFYPTDFEIDMDGKRFSWQGVSKLPFIDETRLLSETRLLEKDLGVGERKKNVKKLDQLLVRCTHKLGSYVMSLSTECNTGKEKYSLCDHDIAGSIWLPHECMVMDKKDDCVLCLLYEPPQCGPHIPRLLDGVKSPEKTIWEDDLEETQLWHEYPGMNKPSSRQMIQEGFSQVSISKNSAAHSNKPIHKHAGSGWGFDRVGRSTNSCNTSEYNNAYYDHQPRHVGARSGWGIGRANPTSNINYSQGVIRSVNLNYASANHSCYSHQSMHIGAGSGWGAGRVNPNSNINSSQGVIGSGNPNYASASYTCYDHHHMHIDASSRQGVIGSGNPNHAVASYASHDHQSMHVDVRPVWGAGRGIPNGDVNSRQGVIGSGNPNHAVASYASYDHQSMHVDARPVFGAGRGMPDGNLNSRQGVLGSGKPYYASASFHQTSDANRGRGNHFIRPSGAVGRANGSFWPSRNSGFTSAWRQISQPDDGVRELKSTDCGLFNEQNSMI